MDVSGMTLEGFFLADYERMRQRIKELEEEVDRLTPDGYGCIDQHETCDAVKVEVESEYRFTSDEYEGIDLDELRSARAMTNEDLMAWATKAYRATRGYYSALQPITIQYHKYQYTLAFNETRGRNIYVTDGEMGSILHPIDFMEEKMVDNLGHWCREEYLDELKEAALSLLRDRLAYAIDKLEEKRGDCDLPR